MQPKTKKIVIAALGVISLFLFNCAVYFYLKTIQASPKQNTNQKEPPKLFSPLTNREEPNLKIQSNPPGDYHILLLGTDQRTPKQQYYRTDAIMVVSILKNEKRVVLTSIPRDLWLSGTKINAHYANEGFDKFKHRIGKVIGIEPDYFVSMGFDGFVWSVNQLGSINTNVERSFIDPKYPPDRPNAPYPVSFETGTQNFSAEKALVYCRSRKGTNGEGNDFQRIRRQQNLLINVPQAFTNSDLVKLSAEALYNLFSGHMQTNLGVGEIAELLPIVKGWKNYKTEQIVLDTNNYLYEPPRDYYGGAYVLKPRGDSFETIHQVVLNKLTGDASTASCNTCEN
ncbi:MAG: LCP family protein [Patescibacteria group bacterium]|nr:LCP family protein [Patescibacteria group bacterium]